MYYDPRDNCSLETKYCDLLSHVSLFLRFDLMCSCSAEYLKARNNGASQDKEKEVKSHLGETE